MKTHILTFAITFCLGMLLVAASADTNKTDKAKSDDTSNTNKTQDAKSGDSPGGTFTIKDLQIETDILANRSMKNIAARIAKQIGAAQPPPASVAFYNETDYKALADYASVISYLRQVKNQYDQIANKFTPETHTAIAAADAALKEAQGIAQSVVNIISMMRSDVNVEGRSVSLAEEALVSAICAELPANVNKYYSKIYVPPPDIDNSPLQTLLEAVNQARGDAISVIVKANKDLKQPNVSDTSPDQHQMEPDVAAAGAAPPAPAGHKNKKDAPKPKDPPKPNENPQGPPPADPNAGSPTFQQLLQDINKSYSQMVAALYGGGTNGGMMASLLRAEKIKELTGASDVIYLKVVSAGGNNATSRNLFTAIFGTPKVLHSGGCIISYVQFGSGGEIKHSGEFDAYTGYYRSKVTGIADLRPNVPVQEDIAPVAKVESPKAAGNH